MAAVNRQSAHVSELLMGYTQHVVSVNDKSIALLGPNIRAIFEQTKNMSKHH